MYPSKSVHKFMHSSNIKMLFFLAVPKRIDGLRAVDVMTILHEKVAYLSGGRDQRPGPILTFPASTRRERLKHDDYRPLLQYLMQIPR